MLNFLKKIFHDGGQEAKKIVGINLHEMEGWLNESSKPMMEEVKQQIGQVLMKINEELQRARFNVDALENAKLQNPNISFKAKQYMEGNRKAYIRSVSSFLGHMEINNRDYFYLMNFCKLFDELINDLNKGTLRSYTILQEFFAHESGKIAQNLKNFDTLFVELKNILNNKKLVLVNQAGGKIQSLKSKIKQRIDLGIDLRNAETCLKLAEEAKNSTIEGIEKFSRGEEHNNFLKLNEEKKAKANAFYEDQSWILQSFSILERPLRKYSHIAFEHEEIVLDYLNKPVETLANDKGFVILEVFKNLEKMLQENRLKIDEKRKEKSLDEIKRLNKEFLEQFVKMHFSFKSEIEELDDRIKATGVAEKFRNFNKQLEELNFSIEKNNKEFEGLRGDSEKLEDSIKKLKTEIENEIKDIFGDEIQIVI